MKSCNYSNYNMQNNQFSNRHRMDGAERSSCCRSNTFLAGQDFPVAMAYVPWTEFMGLYELERGLNAGTIFADLDKPFLGRRAFRR